MRGHCGILWNTFLHTLYHYLDGKIEIVLLCFNNLTITSLVYLLLPTMLDPRSPFQKFISTSGNCHQSFVLHCGGEREKNIMTLVLLKLLLDHLSTCWLPTVVAYHSSIVHNVSIKLENIGKIKTAISFSLLYLKFLSFNLTHLICMFKCPAMCQF